MSTFAFLLLVENLKLEHEPRKYEFGNGKNNEQQGKKTRH
jgi:hypothetical protein